MTQTLEQLKKEIIGEFEITFTDLYGEGDPTHTFHDHDDFLIIRDNIKSFLSSSLDLVAQRTAERLELAQLVVQSLELCWEIEKLPASEQETKTVMIASDLHSKLSKVESQLKSFLGEDIKT